MGGVACGIEPSNSSARSKELYVRFACSAVWRISSEIPTLRLTSENSLF